MLKPNLNRHFAKILPALKISFFLIVWNAVFHSLTLSILLYWSLTSNRVPELSRMSTLNQFWTENQILFAMMCSVSGTLFFKDQLFRFLRSFAIANRVFYLNFLRGTLFAIAMIVSLILTHRYDFLGFSAQLDLNFLSSYAWIIRAVLVLLFVISSEFLTRVVMHSELVENPSNLTRSILETATHLTIYWIWFNPTPSELLTLTLIFLLFSGAWSASGFISALFIMTHAVFGLPFFENEFVGLLQLKSPLASMRGEDTFLQNPYLQLTLVILFVIFRISRMTTLRSSAKISHERKPIL
jgi:hypothetical protein